MFSLVFFYLYYISVFVSFFFFLMLISILYVNERNALIKIIIKNNNKIKLKKRTLKTPFDFF